MRWKSVFKKTSSDNDQTNVPVPSFAPSKSGGHTVSTTPRVISFERDARDPMPPEPMREVALFDGEESIREGPSLEETVEPILNELTDIMKTTAVKAIPTKLPLASGPRKSKHGRFSFKGLFGRRKALKQDDSIASSLPIQVIPESYFEDDEIYGESSLSMDLKNLLAEDESLIAAMMELQPLGVVDHAKLKESPSQSTEESAHPDNVSSLQQNQSNDDAVSQPGKSLESGPVESELFQGWSPVDTLSSWFKTLHTIKLGDFSEREAELVATLPEIDQAVLDDIFSWLETQSSLTIEQFDLINDWFKANSMEASDTSKTEATVHSSKLKASTPEARLSRGIIENFRDQSSELPTSMMKKKWKWYATTGRSPQGDATACSDAQIDPQREEEPREESSTVEEECRDSFDQDDSGSQRLGSAEEENLWENSVSHDSTNDETVSLESNGTSGVWSAYHTPGGQLIDPFSLNKKDEMSDEEARVEAAIRVFRKHAEILGVNERDLLMAVRQSYHGAQHHSDDDESECRESHLDVVRSEYESVAGSVGMDSTIETMPSIDTIDTMETKEHKLPSMGRKKSKAAPNSALSVKTCSSEKSWRSVKTM